MISVMLLKGCQASPSNSSTRSERGKRRTKFSNGRWGRLTCQLVEVVGTVELDAASTEQYSTAAQQRAHAMQTVSKAILSYAGHVGHRVADDRRLRSHQFSSSFLRLAPRQLHGTPIPQCQPIPADSVVKYLNNCNITWTVSSPYSGTN